MSKKIEYMTTQFSLLIKMSLSGKKLTNKQVLQLRDLTDFKGAQIKDRVYQCFTINTERRSDYLRLLNTQRSFFV